MPQIKIYFSGVTSANRILKKAIREFSQLEQGFALLQKSLDPDIQSRYQIAAKLSELRHSSEISGEQIRKLLALTQEGLQRYQETEARLCRSAPDYDELDAR